MPRADVDEVTTELARNVDAGFSLTKQLIVQSIRQANGVWNHAISLASQYGRATVDAFTAKQVEIALAAGFYCDADPLYVQRSNMSASGGFQRSALSKDKLLNEYKEKACQLDYSRTLRPLLEGRVAGASWGGLSPQDPTPADQRGW